MKNRQTITFKANQYLIQTTQNMGNLSKLVCRNLINRIIHPSKLLTFLLIACIVSFAQQALGQTASFTPSATETCTPSTINFTDNSSGATSWLWDFGNSNISNLQNPSANYPQPGVYTVTLTINGGGGPSLVTSQQIHVYPKPNPVVPLAAKGCEPFSTTLTADAIPVVVAPFTIAGTFPAPLLSNVGGITGGAATTYTWNFFGDLPTVVQSSPILNLTNIPVGIYDLFLTVTDDKGCSNSVFKQSVITVSAKPTADFSFLKANLCGTGNVSFTGTSAISSGTIAGYSWDIGNNGSVESTLQNFTYNFTTAGTYPVAFTTSSAEGCTSDKVIRQVIFDNTNSIGFSFTGNCVGQSVSFTDLSSANVASWAWDFDNNGVVDATTQNPTFIYNSTGSFTAKLTVTFIDGCIMTTTLPVTINGATSSFTYSTASACAPGYTIGFASTSIASTGTTITGYAWDFDNNGTTDDITTNPSHSFNASGTYPVRLTVTTSDGCSNSILTNVVIPDAVVDFSAAPFTGCVPLNSVFTPIYNNGSDPIISYSWDFGDPASGVNNISTSATPSHNYTLPGKYNVALTATTTNGCVLTKTNVGIIIAGSPQTITNVISSQAAYCHTTSVDFTATITALTDQLIWNFNDGSTAVTQDVSGVTTSSLTHGYATPGTKSVSVQAFYNGCPSAVYTLGGITVNEPTAGFTPSSTVQCAAPTATISFVNSSISTPANTVWDWNFGDGSPHSSLQSPTHVFNTTGDFIVTLIVNNTLTGCSDQASHTIFVTSSNPLFTANNLVICSGSSTNFTNQVAANSSSNFSVASYLWDFGDGQTSTSPNPSHIYTSPGLYSVKLQVTGTRDCIYTYTRTNYIDVRGPDVDFTNTPVQICSGTLVTFTDATTRAANDPATTNNYYWTFGDGANSTLQNPTHTYVGSGNFTVNLQVTDNLGCVSSKSVTSSVQVPAVTAGFTTPRDNFCVNDLVNFTNSSIGTITSYDWDLNGDGIYEIINGTANQSFTFTATGVYTVKLRITSNLGCQDIFTKSITVVDGTGAIILNNPELGCAPVAASLEPSDPATVVSSYLWSFGDGQTSAARIANHFYTRPGHYTITLNEVLTGGCTRTSSIAIRVAGAVGDFSYDNTPQCAPHPETYFANNLDGVTSLTWDYGDGITQFQPVTGGATTETSTHTYTTWGTRLPILILRDPTCGDYAYYYGVNQRINTSEAPIAAFSYASIANSGQNCQNLSFQFTDLSTIVDPRYAVSTWDWDFGDGSTHSTIQNPTHTYTIAATYHIILTVTNGFIPGGCPATTSHDVVVNPLPVSSGTNQVQEFCSGSSSTDMVLSSTLTGSTLGWTRTTPAGISTTQPLSGSGLAIGGIIPGYAFTNSTSAPIVIAYTITSVGPAPTYCAGVPITATVTVDPIPTVSSPSSKTICNNSAVGYTIASATSGTTFTWTSSQLTAPTGGAITGFANCSSGCGSAINNTLVNSGTSPGVVRYVITPTGPNPTDCPGIPFNLDVTVNPTSTIIFTPTAQTICDGHTTSIGLTTGATGATVSYSWTATLNTGAAAGFSSGSGTIIAQTLVNANPPPSTITYHVTPAIGTCTGTPSDVVVTVNPGGEVDQPASQYVCNNSITTPVNFTTTNLIGTTTFTWTNNNTTIGLAASGSGNIGAFTSKNSGTSPVIATIIVTPDFDNAGVICDGATKTFTITVNPTGQVTQPADLVVCNGATGAVTFATTNSGGTTTYTWTNDNTAIGLTANGTGNISFTATNSTTAPVSANVTVTPSYKNGDATCVGPSKTFAITVNPSGEVNNPGNQTLCNNSSTAPITFTTNNTVGTTTYSWTNSKTSIGLAASGSGDIASFTATNSGTSPVVATIVVTPHFSNGSVSCSGTTQSFTITVNPTPKVNSAAAKTICSNSAVGYTITSLTTGATFTWTASLLTAPTGGTITGFSDCTSGCLPSINHTLVNSGTSTGIVRYVITPTGPASTNCPGTPFNFDVTVQPVATVIATPSSQTVCHNTATNIALTTGTTGTISYSWTASLNTGTATGFSSGSGVTIAQTLSNTTTSPATVTYHITPLIGSCSGTPLDVVVTVNPRGEVDQPASQVVCNNAASTAINFTTTNLVGTTTYTWTNNTSSIGLAASGSGNIGTFTATNSGLAPVVATLIVTPHFDNGGTVCAGSPKTFTITVNPTAGVIQPADQVVCNAASEAVTFATGNTGGSTTYSWTNDNTSIGLGASGNGSLSFTATNGTTAPHHCQYCCNANIF